MNFITLTLVEGGHLVAIRHDEVRVLEAHEYKKFEEGEWKEEAASATLVKTSDGSSYTVTESVANILKQLETPR